MRNLGRGTFGISLARQSARKLFPTHKRWFHDFWYFSKNIL